MQWTGTVVLITGEVADLRIMYLHTDNSLAQTDEKHGQAWGSFTFTGYVRTSDGWISLCRRPVRDPFFPPGLGLTCLLGARRGTRYMDI